MKTLLGFIGVIILLWFIWFVTGGPQRYEDEGGQGKFIKPPRPLDTGETYN